MIASAGQLRGSLVAAVRRTFGETPTSFAPYTDPPGDPGLFGPDSMVWVVHADLADMMIGGVAALMLQTLHPLAMAGVAAHSRFREDPLGRLQRTAHFIAGTTYGSTAYAEDLVAQVRAVHERVRGLAPDGRPYRASDPDLLTFVHVTEVSSFLAAHQRYSGRPLLRREKDQYLDEVAATARRLGALAVPTSVVAVRSYLADILPELSFGAQATEALEFLRRPLGASASEAYAHRLVIAAASDLLPRFARRLIGLPATARSTAPLVRAAAGSLAVTLRWALGPSPLLEFATARAQIPLSAPSSRPR